MSQVRGIQDDWISSCGVRRVSSTMGIAVVAGEADDTPTYRKQHRDVVEMAHRFGKIKLIGG
jgi:hypothetical protein